MKYMLVYSPVYRAVGSQKDILEAVESIYTQSAQKKEEKVRMIWSEI